MTNISLSEIRQNLNEFQLIQCGLKHEGVILDSKTHLPLKTGPLNEEIYKRVDLCNLKDRNQRLGCSHSFANSAFNRSIEELSKKDPIVEKLKEQFNEIVLKIYLLDHKKGNLEHTFAETLEINSSCELSSSDVEKELDTCVQIHSEYINQLGNIKSDIIQHIDAIIGLEKK